MRRAELDLADGLGDRLAHLADDDFGELLGPLGVQLADPAIRAARSATVVDADQVRWASSAAAIASRSASSVIVG